MCLCVLLEEEGLLLQEERSALRKHSHLDFHESLQKNVRITIKAQSHKSVLLDVNYVFVQTKLNLHSALKSTVAVRESHWLRGKERGAVGVTPRKSGLEKEAEPVGMSWVAPLR